MTTPEGPALLFELGRTGWSRARRHLAAAGYQLSPVGARAGRAVFWDTPDGRLDRRGHRLLLWEDRTSWRLLLVHPSGVEEELLHGPGRAAMGPVLAPSSWESLGERAALLPEKPLVPTGEAYVRRRAFTLLTPSGTVLLAEVQAWEPPEKGWVPALLKVAAGPGAGEASLGHLEVLLRDRAGLSPAPGDLAHLLLPREGGQDPAFRTGMEAALRPDEPMGAAGRRLLGRQLFRLEAHLPWALRDLHPEFVHDARVAARRARTLLRLAGPALGPKRAESLRGDLRWAAALLGEVRDLDVFLEVLERYARELPPDIPAPRSLMERLAEERRAALAALREGFSGRRLPRLLARLRRLVQSPPPRGRRGAAAEKAGDAARRIAGRQIRRALKAADSLGPSPSPEALHRLRILFKRARYALEFFREVLPEEAGACIEAAVALQEVLGSHQDAVVAVRRLREAAERPSLPPGELVASGVLLQRFWQSAEAARGNLGGGLRRFRRAWRALRRRLRSPSPETLGPRHP